MNVEAVEILLVEDSPGDVRLTQEALKDSKLYNNLSVVPDGVEAMAFLRRQEQYTNAPRPDLILLSHDRVLVYPQDAPAKDSQTAGAVAK